MPKNWINRRKPRVVIHPTNNNNNNKHNILWCLFNLHNNIKIKKPINLKNRLKRRRRIRAEVVL